MDGSIRNEASLLQFESDDGKTHFEAADARLQVGNHNQARFNLLTTHHKTDTEEIKTGVGANFELGNRGVNAGINADLTYKTEIEDGVTLDTGVSGGAEIGRNVTAEVNLRVAHVDVELPGGSMQTGLQLDTGASVGADGVRASFLGVGFHAGGGRGFGIKLPFIGFTFGGKR